MVIGDTGVFLGVVERLIFVGKMWLLERFSSDCTRCLISGIVVVVEMKQFRFKHGMKYEPAEEICLSFHL